MEKKALLVIDVQREYMKKYDAGLLPEINTHIVQAENDGQLVVYIKNVRNLRSGPQVYDFADDLKLCSSHVLLKCKASAFSNEELCALLEENHITEIEIIGIDGCGCVASSAADACKSGYAVALPCRLIGALNQERFEQKKEKLRLLGAVIR